MEEKNNISIIKIGAWAGAITAILAFLWLIGEPFLEDYVDDHISTYDERKKEEESHKVGLRLLLSDKMGVDDDEVHIAIGHMYKKEMRLYKEIDSLKNTIAIMKKEIKDNYSEIGMNYSDIKNLYKSNDAIKKQLDKHGLFR